jgi:hypothetical protein
LQLILTVTAQLGISTHAWTWANHVGIWIVQLAVFLIAAICLNVPPWVYLTGNWPLYGVVFWLFSTPIFWLLIFTVPIVAVLPNYVGAAVYRNYFPKPYHFLQEHLSREEHMGFCGSCVCPGKDERDLASSLNEGFRKM